MLFTFIYNIISNLSIWIWNRTLMGTTSLGQSELGNNGNEGMAPYFIEI